MTYLMRHIVRRQLIQHVLRNPLHNRLARLTHIATRLLRLNIQNRVQNILGRVRLIRNRRVAMQPERLGPIKRGQRAYKAHNIIQPTVLRYTVNLFAEHKTLPEHVLAKPSIGKGLQQRLVKVVGDSTPVLTLANHVLDRFPADATLRVHLVQMVLM